MLYFGPALLFGASTMFAPSFPRPSLARVRKSQEKTLVIITPGAEVGLCNSLRAAFPAKLLRGKGSNPQRGLVFHAKKGENPVML
jgi:hypothetical protein